MATITRLQRAALYLATLPALVGLQSCGDSAGPAPVVALEFVPPVVVLVGVRDTVVQLRNTGTVVVGPIEVSKGALVDSAGTEIAASPLLISPSQIPTLDSGSAQSISISVDTSAIQVGSYQVGLEAHTAEGTLASLDVRFAIEPPPPPPPTVSITSGPTTVRQGDVVRYTAEARDASGNVIGTISWSVTPSNAGFIGADGRFVGFAPGSAGIVAGARARTSTAADTLPVTITARGLSGSFRVVGHGEVLSRNSDHISVHGTFAYTGTIDCYRSCGDRLLVWDISDPANPTLTDSVVAVGGGRRVNDVMVRADGAIAAITHEGGAGGITLLDLSDPAHPTVIKRFTEGLNTDTHNLWIDGEYIYVATCCVSGQTGSGLVVVDITNLQNPAVVASYTFGSVGALYGVSAHDVQVRDGLAMVSNWEAGLIILDVGGGGAGGSPANAIELSRTRTPAGWTHNAWYWPATGYVFIADEPQVSGVLAPTVYVMDAREPSSPKLVATYTIPGSDPHNFWLDEDRGILYVAWLRHGVRAIDVTGTLMGALERQGRQIAGLAYDAGDCRTASQVGPTGTGTCSLSLQVRDGLVYVWDYTTGLWILQFQP